MQLEKRPVVNVRDTIIESDNVENGKAMRYIQYALSRRYHAISILIYPITSRPIFLLEKNYLYLKSQTSLIWQLSC